MSIPEWLEPMAATLTQDRFTGPDWMFERKFDGIRLLAYKQGDDVRLYSRNRRPQSLPKSKARRGEPREPELRLAPQKYAERRHARPGAGIKRSRGVMTKKPR